jgi:hypothetical protein
LYNSEVKEGQAEKKKAAVSLSLVVFLGGGTMPKGVDRESQ